MALGNVKERLRKTCAEQFNNRQDWLDVLRAMAMLFVIYGHISKLGEFYLFTNPIKIPLFFAISGFLMYGREGNPKVFFSRMLKRIIIPWLILALGFGLRFILTQGPEYYVNFFLDNLTGVRAWYIVCCIISQTIFYFLQKWLGTGWKLGVAVALLTAAGLTLTHFGVGDLFQFRTALICLFYLLIGYWLKKYEHKIFNIKIWLPIGMLCAYIVLIVASTFIFQKRSLDVHMDKYYNIPYCFLLITVGCVALFLCASRIKKYPRWLVGIGRNTLVFYLHDTFWRGIAARGLAILGISIPKTWYGALIWLTISCIGCGFEAYVLNKYFPEANGKTRKKKSKQVNA